MEVRVQIAMTGLLLPGPGMATSACYHLSNSVMISLTKNVTNAAATLEIFGLIEERQSGVIMRFLFFFPDACLL